MAHSRGVRSAIYRHLGAPVPLATNVASQMIPSLGVPAAPDREHGILDDEDIDRDLAQRLRLRERSFFGAPTPVRCKVSWRAAQTDVETRPPPLRRCGGRLAIHAPSSRNKRPMIPKRHASARRSWRSCAGSSPAILPAVRAGASPTSVEATDCAGDAGATVGTSRPDRYAWYRGGQGSRSGHRQARHCSRNGE